MHYEIGKKSNDRARDWKMGEIYMYLGHNAGTRRKTRDDFEIDRVDLQTVAGTQSHTGVFAEIGLDVSGATRQRYNEKSKEMKIEK
jgi:hypothetical protein